MQWPSMFETKLAYSHKCGPHKSHFSFAFNLFHSHIKNISQFVLEGEIVLKTFSASSSPPSPHSPSPPWASPRRASSASFCSSSDLCCCAARWTFCSWQRCLHGSSSGPYSFWLPHHIFFPPCTASHFPSDGRWWLEWGQTLLFLFESLSKFCSQFQFLQGEKEGRRWQLEGGLGRKLSSSPWCLASLSFYCSHCLLPLDNLALECFEDSKTGQLACLLWRTDALESLQCHCHLHSVMSLGLVIDNVAFTIFTLVNHLSRNSGCLRYFQTTEGLGGVEAFNVIVPPLLSLLLPYRAGCSIRQLISLAFLTVLLWLSSYFQFQDLHSQFYFHSLDLQFWLAGAG